MRDRLLESAADLRQPGPEAQAEFSDKRSAVTAQCTRLFEQRRDLDRLVGKENIDMARDNNKNFSRFMASIFEEFDPRVLVDTVLWVFTAYRSHGFHTTYWAANLNIWMDVLESKLAAESWEEISPFYRWLVVNIPLFTALTEDAVNDPRSQETMARRHGSGTGPDPV